VDGGTPQTAEKATARRSRARTETLADLAAAQTLSTGSVDAYLASISRIPFLNAAEEQRLARRLRDNNDLQAAQQLVLSNLRFVAHVARGYLAYGLPLADLIQEGNVGLMKAVRHFDPDKGVRMISFAVHWIKAEIHEYVVRNWRIVKVATTKAQRKLFFSLRSMKQHVGWMNRAEVDAIAKQLKVPREEVLTMESRLTQPEVSFHGTPTGGEHGYGPEDYLTDGHDASTELEQTQWSAQLERRMNKALVALDDRSRDIVMRRWLHRGRKAQLHELADKYGVSAERIRQIQSHAFAQMRAHMSASDALAA
jgi:RNA polymerase sigma-32 factor